jgi:molecular chaperone DnaK
LEEAIKGENVDSIEASTKELNDVLTPLTQKLYTPEEGATASDTEGDASDNAGDNTVDAEFEEVKEEDK